MNIRYDFARAGSSTGEIKIEAIRRIFKIVAPVVSRIGGKLTRIMEEGISAVFENSTEDALHAADEIFLAASASLSAEDISRLSIGIHYGEVYMGSVKYRDFVAPIVISEGVYTAWHLCDAASRYDARVLISDKAVERVRSFENRFSSRKLGKVYLPSRRIMPFVSLSMGPILPSASVVKPVVPTLPQYSSTLSVNTSTAAPLFTALTASLSA